MSNLKYNENLSINLGARYVKSTTEFDDTFTTGIPIDADLSSDSKQIYLLAGVEKSSPQINVLHKFNIRHLGTERQDFNLNLSSMSEKQLKNETVKWLERLNKTFGNTLNKGKLLKTGGFDKHSKHQNSKDRKGRITTFWLKVDNNKVSIALGWRNEILS